MFDECDCSCSRVAASTNDIESKSRNYSPWFTLDDFDIGGLLGDGAHGQVFLARERRTGFICVLKCISKAQLVGSGQESMFKREIELHSHLRHPNISCLYTWFTTKSMIFMVIEYCHNGDLFTYLMRRKRLQEREVCEIMFQVIWAIRTCHDKNIAHLDIKPENILLDHDNVVKLADFGLSARINTYKEDPTSIDHITFLRGTYDYWSPEQCAHKYDLGDKFGEFGCKTDIWTIGVLAFELFFGLAPFGTTAEEELDIVLGRIQNLAWYEFWQKKHRNLRISEMSPEFRDFLDACFTKVSTFRPNSEQLLQHPWIRRYNGHRFNDTQFLQQPRHEM